MHVEVRHGEVARRVWEDVGPDLVHSHRRGEPILGVRRCGSVRRVVLREVRRVLVPRAAPDNTPLDIKNHSKLRIESVDTCSHFHSAYDDEETEEAPTKEEEDAADDDEEDDFKEAKEEDEDDEERQTLSVPRF